MYVYIRVGYGLSQKSIAIRHLLYIMCTYCTVFHTVHCTVYSTGCVKHTKMGNIKILDLT